MRDPSLEVRELVSVIDATRILSVRDSTIYRWIAQGILTPTSTDPIRFDLADLERQIESHRIATSRRGEPGAD